MFFLKVNISQEKTKTNSVYKMLNNLLKSTLHYLHHYVMTVLVNKYESN